MDMTVNDARQYMFALDVDFFFALRQGIVRADGDDLFIADRDAALERRLRSDHPTIFYN